MKVCGMAGAQCPREATVTVRIFGVGDRNLCQQDYDWMVSVGMDVRVLDPNAYVPQWRLKSLSKDLTGTVAA